MKNIIIKIGIALILTFCSWALLITFRDYLLLVFLVFVVSIASCVLLFREYRIMRTLMLAANPFISLTLVSFLSGTVSVVRGHPQLVFVCYHTDDLPYCNRDTEITSRRSIDPEMGVLDYIYSVPNNMMVRFLMTCTGRVDNSFVLIYPNELPDELIIH
jgi:hypothetical protein